MERKTLRQQQARCVVGSVRRVVQGEQFEGGQFGESIQRGWSQTLEGPNEKESHCCVLTKG